MHTWKITFYGIQWQPSAIACRADYDCTDLPDNVGVRVDAESEDQAIEYAMLEVIDEFGANVAATEQIRAEIIA